MCGGVWRERVWKGEREGVREERSISTEATLFISDRGLPSPSALRFRERRRARPVMPASRRAGSSGAPAQARRYSWRAAAAPPGAPDRAGPAAPGVRCREAHCFERFDPDVGRKRSDGRSG